MIVPFSDLALGTAELRRQLELAISRVLSSGWYVGGEEVERFEQEFGDYCGTAHCVSTGNGFDALHLALRAFDIGPGDEVIVASNSYAATVLAVTHVGATPVFVEPNYLTRNLAPEHLRSAIGPRTRAILPTHLYGFPADLDRILDVASEYNLIVVEDAAQAHGATYKGRRLGGHGHAVAWSFYPTKNLGAFGDGGALTTNDPAIAKRLMRLRNYGSSQRYLSQEKGVNSRLDPLQAAVLRVKLEHLDRWNERRKRVAEAYLSAFSRLPIVLPTEPDGLCSAWHLFVISLRNRDMLAKRLKIAGVETVVHYPVPPHLQEAFADLKQPAGSLPVAEQLAREVLSLPISPHLSPEQIERVISEVTLAFH